MMTSTHALLSCLQPARRLLAGTFVAAGLAFSPQVTAQPSGIPSMGSASSQELSPALEQLLGDAIMEQGRRDPAYVSDLEVSQYLVRLGERLAAHAPPHDQTIRVFGVRDPQINAFAMPGGYIGVNSGLVVQSESESELASVVAHEIGHVALRHIARGMTQQSQSSGVMLASVAGALLAALAGSADLAMGVAAFGQAAAISQQLGFSRQAEQEADRVGLDMLRKSGFDPQGMVRMFGRLMSVSRLNEGMAGGSYHSTHPQSIQRMSDIENRVRELRGTTHRDSDDFWYVRARLRVLQARDGRAQQAAREALQQETRSDDKQRQGAAWYGLALAALAQNAPEAARQAVEQAQQVAGVSPYVAQLQVRLALRAKDHVAALAQARQAWQRWPDSQGVALAFSEALQAAGDDAQAVAFLRERIGQWPGEPRFHELYAKSQERAGNAVEARRAMATYYEMVGALPTAVAQLRQARQLTDDFYLQSELDMRIRVLRQRVETERELLKRFRS